MGSSPVTPDPSIVVGDGLPLMVTRPSWHERSLTAGKRRPWTGVRGRRSSAVVTCGSAGPGRGGREGLGGGRGPFLHVEVDHAVGPPSTAVDDAGTVALAVVEEVEVVSHQLHLVERL